MLIKLRGSSNEKRLYELIWKRTIASQMSDARLEKTTAQIISSVDERFVATGEVVTFDGFLKVYMESSDDDNEEQAGMLPKLTYGDGLSLIEMRARQRFTRQPSRYTEASLVKKMEELGIGRPSTYAPTISTIQKREYVVKESRPAKKRSILLMTLKEGKIADEKIKENIDTGKTRLYPTDIGILVTRFLTEFFDNIIDYNFTAKVEKEFDEISDGKKKWNQMIKEFYGPFHKKIESTQKESGKFSGERLLGTDPETGKNVFVKIGRYGPIVQLGDTDSDDKPKFAGLPKNKSIENITLEEALKLFDFPRQIGSFEDHELTVAIGRVGPYVKHNNKFYSLKKEDNPALIDREQNFKIPKEYEPKSLTLDDCYKIAADPDNKPKKRYYRKKK